LAYWLAVLVVSLAVLVAVVLLLESCDQSSLETRSPRSLGAGAPAVTSDRGTLYRL